MFLLSGDAIVNESMLTGESVPVSKIPVADDVLAGWQDATEVGGDASKAFLYSGTKVVRIRGALGGGDDAPACALVVRTGFTTTKGALVRSMLFPKPMGFKFYRDSIRFIGVLTGIAGLGFLASAAQFVRLGVPAHIIALRALDLVTVVVPPALPATLSIGTSFALARLRAAGVFCIAPSRVNVAGKVNVVCFDKTGTLTEDGLDVLGVRTHAPGGRFGELVGDARDLPAEPSGERARFLHALATCHSLKMIDGEALGDPLDAKMFEFTRWALEEGALAGTGVIKDRGGGARPAALVQTVVRPPGGGAFRVADALRGGERRAHFLELGVIRTFEFASALRRMSVVVKRLKSSSMEVYVKGAPEVMAEICERESCECAGCAEEAGANGRSPAGLRRHVVVLHPARLSCHCHRRQERRGAVVAQSAEDEAVSRTPQDHEPTLTLHSEQAESGLRFLGLIIFENKLKPGTAPAIQALRAAHLPCRMITGDNPLTAVSVARECGLVSQAAHVFAPAFVRGNASMPTAQLAWTSMDYPAWTLDEYSLRPRPAPPHVVVEEDEEEVHDYALVLTGDVFRWMVTYAAPETLQRVWATHVTAEHGADTRGRCS
jgi:cation-transporting ATPase 13A2